MTAYWKPQAMPSTKPISPSTFARRLIFDGANLDPKQRTLRRKLSQSFFGYCLALSFAFALGIGFGLFLR